MLYFLPLIEDKNSYGVKNIKQSILKAILAHPFLSLSIFLFLLFFNALMLVSRLGFLMLSVGVTASVLVNLAYAMFAEQLGQEQTNDYIRSLEQRRIFKSKL